MAGLVQVFYISKIYNFDYQLGLPRYTHIVAAPRIAAMLIVFEYTHLYIRIQTNIHKNEMLYLFAALDIVKMMISLQNSSAKF